MTAFKWEDIWEDIHAWQEKHDAAVHHNQLQYHGASGGAMNIAFTQLALERLMIASVLPAKPER